MALHTDTADAWIKAFAISLFLYGASSIIAGIISLLIGIAAPVSAFADWAEKSATVFASIFSLLFGALLIIWSRGMLTRQGWSRIIMVVAGYAGAVISAVMIIGGVALMLMPGLLPMPGLSTLMGAFLVIIAILLGAFSGLGIWIFQAEQAVVSLFKKPITLALDEPSAAGFVRAWALLTWLFAVYIALFTALVLLFSPIIGKVLLSVMSVTAGKVAAVTAALAALAFGFALLLHFVSKGLWNFSNWARIMIIVFAGISAAFYVYSLGYVLFQGEGIIAIGNAVSKAIYVLGLSAAQIWFFTSDLVKPLFGVGTPSGRPTGQARRTVKKK